MRRHSHDIVYAWNKEKTLVHVSTVENGLDCQCICPNCKAPLVAKNNTRNIRELHFAHFKGHDCKGAYESTMHLLAKEVLKETKTLWVPEFRKDKYSQTRKFDDVIVEPILTIGDTTIRPDALCRIGEKQLLVEFYFTHKVDPDKMQILWDNDIACLEIDISRQDMDKEKLKEYFGRGSPGIKWVSNPQLTRPPQYPRKYNVENYYRPPKKDLSPEEKDRRAQCRKIKEQGGCTEDCPYKELRFSVCNKTWQLSCPGLDDDDAN